MTHAQVVVEVVRSGFVESRHHGSVVAVDAHGAVLWSVGDVAGQIYPRSCNKPIQALGMLRAGLDIEGELLALASASHSGEPFHLDGVRRLLASAGLSEEMLQTPPDYPLEETARVDYIRAGLDKAPVAMNCSGKHAAMLVTSAVNGWPLSSYRSPDHPVQRAIADTFAGATGEPVSSVGTDGCGAPLLATSLTGLARAFSKLATAPAGTLEHRVATAIRQAPQHASGTRRDEAALLRAIPGAVGKAGAEASYAVALPDGRAVALKIEDGGVRARRVVMAAALRRLEVDRLPGVDAAAVDATGVVELFGGAEPVGQLRSVW